MDGVVGSVADDTVRWVTNDDVKQDIGAPKQKVAFYDGGRRKATAGVPNSLRVNIYADEFMMSAITLREGGKEGG